MPDIVLGRHPGDHRACGGGALALSIIAVSGAALYGGIDVYTKNFLFGVENIESVRTLTMKTLNDNAAELMADPRTLGFQDVASAIMDNQEMCKPASIAAAVRIKLRSGASGFEAAETGGGSVLSDRAVVARISELVGLPTGVLMNDGQLALVCFGDDSRRLIEASDYQAPAWRHLQEWPQYARLAWSIIKRRLCLPTAAF